MAYQSHVPGEVELVVIGPVFESRVNLLHPHRRGDRAVVIGRARNVQRMGLQEIDHQGGYAQTVEHGTASTELAAQTSKHLRGAS